ncbi:MAG: NUDIX domain-containing protein [Candidatus Saccharimonadales bacterium]
MYECNPIDELLDTAIEQYETAPNDGVAIIITNSDGKILALQRGEEITIPTETLHTDEGVADGISRCLEEEISPVFSTDARDVTLHIFDVAGYHSDGVHSEDGYRVSIAHIKCKGDYDPVGFFKPNVECSNAFWIDQADLLQHSSLRFPDLHKLALSLLA